MVESLNIVGERTAEMTLRSACLFCGGDLQLRVSPGVARTYCPTCHVILKPKVAWTGEGFSVDHTDVALA